MRFHETFTVARPPEDVFDYVTDPSNLAAWQTVNRGVEQLTDGPPGLGSRFRERTKPPAGREFVQITEFVAFDRPRLLKVHVIEGPVPVDGTWAFAPEGPGTRVNFTAEGELHGVLKLVEPITTRLMARQFAGYHRNLRRNLEGG
jgi:uncharacterized protein YndB with AHSA1/START domain